MKFERFFRKRSILGSDYFGRNTRCNRVGGTSFVPKEFVAITATSPIVTLEKDCSVISYPNVIS